MFHEPVLLSSAKFHRKSSVIRSLVRLYSASAVAFALRISELPELNIAPAVIEPVHFGSVGAAPGAWAAASAVASAGWVASTVGCASVDASAATGWLDSVARETALGACAAASIATEIRVSMGVGLAVSSSSGGIGRRVDADAERGSGFLIGARLASEQSGVVGARAVAFT